MAVRSVIFGPIGPGSDRPLPVPERLPRFAWSRACVALDQRSHPPEPWNGGFEDAAPAGAASAVRAV